MQPAEEKTDVGVIVARFQVHELHQGHLDLIESVRKRHSKVIVVLGISPLAVSRRNPLDFQMREQMVRASCPDAIVVGCPDTGDDLYWSMKLNEIIDLYISPGQSVTLYGGRKSFVNHYHGLGPTVVMEHEEEQFFSGDVIRDQLRKSVIDDASFRAGVIWAAYNQYPKTVPTVDVAVFNELSVNRHTKLLMARKPSEVNYRFIGGHADPDSYSYEDDAAREVREEAAIEITTPEYIGSFKIDDWRYRGEVDQIKTSFYLAHHVSGTPEPRDDIEELRWFAVSDLADTNWQHSVHQPLFKALRKRFNINLSK